MKQEPCLTWSMRSNRPESVSIGYFKKEYGSRETTPMFWHDSGPISDDL